MEHLDLSIIIVNWNTADHLGVCLESLQRSLILIRWEVIVVDNTSQDHWQEVIGDVCPHAHVIENLDNMGFAAAANQGFEKARGRFILILNPDTFVCRGAIETLMKILDDHPEIGIVGPKVVDRNEFIEPACRRQRVSLWRILKGQLLFDRLYVALLRLASKTRFGSPFLEPFSRSGPAPCLQGSCVMMRKEDLDRLGLFDARVPLYLDDNDLCARFAKAGFDVHYCADAQVVHTGAASVKKLLNPRMTSMMRHLAHDAYFLKHHSWVHVAAHHAILFFSSILHLLGDALLFPFLVFFKRGFIAEYAVMHFWTLIYSVRFRFWTRALPASWPRSILPFSGKTIQK